MAITGWDLSWIFSVGDPKYDAAPYREYGTLTLHDEIRHPAPFRYPRAEIALSGQVLLPRFEPTAVRPSIGFLDTRDDLLRAYVTARSIAWPC
ncbi:MAG: hypothetical protein IRZ07_25150 [Microbispora sp.]|nr:hypothetical protein [Microbispora sp.]